MAHSNTFILLILWMIIVMIGTSNTGKRKPYKKLTFLLSPGLGEMTFY
jgi:uncharacterized membrane protein YjdF